jgi:hypothetical protein
MPRKASLVILNKRFEVLQYFVFLILATACGFYTYRGCTLIEEGADMFTKAGCALFALAITATFFVAWSAIYAQVPLLSRRNFRLSLIIVAAMAFSSVGISSFFGSAGFIGPAAMTRDLEKTLEQSSDALSETTARARDNLAAVSTLALNEQKWRRLAENEAKGKGPSSIIGPGPVSGMLEQAAVVMGTAARQVEAKIARADELTQGSEVLLAQMRRTLNDPALTVGQKVQKFAIDAESLRLKLVEMSRLEARSNVRQAAAAMRETVRSAAPTNDRQKAVIEQLSTQFGQLDSLNQVMADSKPVPAFLGQPYRSISIYAATLAYALDFLPIVLATILAELVPLPLLFLRLLAIRDLEDNSNGDTLRSLARQYTVEDLLQLAELEHLLAAQRPQRPATFAAPAAAGAGIRDASIRVLPGPAGR